MSTIYDNWEGIAWAVLQKEELWELFHADSIPSEEYSSSNAMHGKKVEIINSLDWESRLRIAICIAKAIANTHSQCNEKVLKLPNKHIIDLRLKNKAATSIVVPTTSYRAPEVNDSCKSSQLSDIYSFGVLLLEFLTGTFPVNGSVIRKRHLVRWITQRFLEVGTLIVYEFVPVKNHTELIEMWKMLLVAIKCVGEDPAHRPESMSDVVKMMEDVRILHP